MKNLNTINIFLYTLILSIIVTAVIHILPLAFKAPFFNIFVWIGISYILWPFIKINGAWILYYSFNKNRDWWNVNIQRPRILFYLIYFIIFYLLIKNSGYIESNKLLMIYHFLLSFYVVAGIFLFRYKIWTFDFENKILPLISDMVTVNNVSFRNLSEHEINILFKEFKKDIDESSHNDFLIFLKSGKSENKIIWKGTSGKKNVTYRDLFLLIHNILLDNEMNFIRNQRRQFLEIICNNFMKLEGNKLEDIVYLNIYSAYSGFNIKKYSKLIV